MKLQLIKAGGYPDAIIDTEQPGRIIIQIKDVWVDVTFDKSTGVTAEVFNEKESRESVSVDFS